MKKNLTILLIMFISVCFIGNVNAYSCYTSFISPYLEEGIKKEGNIVSLPISFEQRKGTDYNFEYDKSIIKNVKFKSKYLDYNSETNKYIVNEDGELKGNRFENIIGNIEIEFIDIKNINGDIKIKVLSDSGFTEIDSNNYNNLVLNEKEIIISANSIINSSYNIDTKNIEFREFIGYDQNYEKTYKSITKKENGNDIDLIVDRDSSFILDIDIKEELNDVHYTIMVDDKKYYSNFIPSYKFESTTYDYNSNLCNGGYPTLGASINIGKNNIPKIKLIFESLDRTVKKEVNVRIKYYDQVQNNENNNLEQNDNQTFNKNKSFDIMYIIYGALGIVIVVSSTLLIINLKKSK